MVSAYPITGAVKFGQFVKLVFAKFLHGKVN